MPALQLEIHDTNGVPPTGDNAAFLQDGLGTTDDIDLMMMAELDSIDWAQDSLLLNFT